MSVATEFPPVVYVPPAARRPGERTATVLAFRARVESGAEAGPARAASLPAASLRAAAEAVPQLYPVLPAPARRSTAGRTDPATRAVAVRLTRRGYAVAGLLVVALTVGLVWLAHASAISAAPPAVKPPAVVTVNAGDTLWSIASRVAPQRDPRAVVAELQRVNHLSDPLLRPGQQLRTR